MASADQISTTEQPVEELHNVVADEAIDAEARPCAVRGFDSGSGVVEEAVQAESHEIPGFASLWCQVQYIERSSCLTP